MLQVGLALARLRAPHRLVRVRAPTRDVLVEQPARRLHAGVVGRLPRAVAATSVQHHLLYSAKITRLFREIEITFWRFSEVFERFWRYFRGISEVFPRNFGGVFGGIYEVFGVLEVFRGFWRFLEVFGGFPRFSEVFGNISGVFGGIWSGFWRRYLANTRL
ncbi:MAG: hypothetical protein CME32_25850 [Gimesia sp.]|nr:hypothetical protein [Gimesia sp.]